MKNNLNFLIFSFLLIFSCISEKDKKLNLKEPDSTSYKEPSKMEVQKITLYEDSVNGMKIPFDNQNVLETLRREFYSFIVKKEVGQQDGPDFPLYTIQDGKHQILFLSMDSEDTLRLNDIYVQSPLVCDMYGLKVGDNYTSIIKMRDPGFKNYSNYHGHTYLYKNDSKIMYEIEGNLELPDSVDLKNFQLTEDQLKDWKILSIIWRNKY